MGRVLVTGGLGFVGSHLVERLVGDGHEVTVIDALVPTHGGDRARIAAFGDAVDVHVMDMAELAGDQAVVRGHDVVFNLAGQRSHVDSMRDPLTDLHHNCHAQLALLEACRSEIPRARVVFASTRQVYGRPRHLPVSEDHALDPVDMNGVHKAAAESHHLLYHSIYGLGAVVLRPTNTYGPRMWIADARQGFFGWWINRLLAGEELEVFGDGTSRRDLNYVDDVVEAFVRVGEVDGIDGRVYNLGAPDPISLSELARKLVAEFGSGSYRRVPFPPEVEKIDIGDFAASYERIQRELGWAPRIDLTDGLRTTLRSFTHAGGEP